MTLHPKPEKVIERFACTCAGLMLCGACLSLKADVSIHNLPVGPCGHDLALLGARMLLGPY